LKIIFTVTNDLNGDQRMMRICDTLQSNGFDVTLIGRTKKNSKSLQKQSYQQHRLYCFTQSGKLFYVEYNIRLFFYLLFKRFNALCSIDLDTVLVGIALKKVKKFKLYYDAHELFPHVPEVISRPSIQKIWLKIEGAAFKYCDEIYTVGAEIANYLEQRYQRKVGVVRNMPLLNETWPPVEVVCSEPYILYQGAVNHGRGLERLFRILKNLPYHLVIIGVGDILEKLKAMAQTLKIEDRVHFLGWVPPNLLPAYSRQAFVGYNVSEAEGLSYYLSLNNKFFDFVEAELPSVINDFPEYNGLIQQYKVGLLTDINDEDITKQLNSLYNNELLYESIKQQCREARKSWNWDLESKKLIKFYTDLNGRTHD